MFVKETCVPQGTERPKSELRIRRMFPEFGGSPQSSAEFGGIRWKSPEFGGIRWNSVDVPRVRRKSPEFGGILSWF